MKMIQTLLVCLFSLTVIIGCGDIEDASDSVNLSLSAEALPADDDIQGFYNMGIPHNRQETAVPAAPTLAFDVIMEVKEDQEKAHLEPVRIVEVKEDLEPIRNETDISDTSKAKKFPEN